MNQFNYFIHAEIEENKKIAVPISKDSNGIRWNGFGGMCCLDAIINDYDQTGSKRKNLGKNTW